MVEFVKNEYVTANHDIHYDEIYAGENDITSGDLGQVKKVLRNVQIKAVKLFCEEKGMKEEELGMGHSTFLSINWLTGKQKGNCLRTHKSNVSKISDEEAKYLLKIKK